LVKNYRISVKTLNLIHNEIESSILNEIQHFVENEYEIKSVQINNSILPLTNNLKQEQLNHSAVKQDLELRIRDQIKLDNYVQNANNFNNQKRNLTKNNNITEYMVKDYENILEHDFKLIKEKSKLNHNQLESDLGELIVPNDDLRYKKHVVLPFNLND
jgi:hypothetical protein